MLSSHADHVLINTTTGFMHLALKYENDDLTSSCKPVHLGSDSDFDDSSIVCQALSRSGQILCCMNQAKQLSLYRWNNADQFDYLGSNQLPRLATCLNVSSDDHFVIASDKSGSVYKFNTSDFSSTPTGKRDDLVPIIGHLSILSDIAISDDNKLIATCDRDEKIRVSRFFQPYIIESFCLGHESFISQITFISDSYLLISAGGDGYLRLWNAFTSCELAASPLHFPDCRTDHNLSGNGWSDKPVVSRLRLVNPDLCIGCSSSHPVIFAVRFNTIKKPTWGRLSHTFVTENQPLIDITTCLVPKSGEDQTLLVGLTASTVLLWTLCFTTDASAPAVFSQLSSVNNLTNLSLKLQDPNPRLELLKLLCKETNDHSMVDLYEEKKSAHQQAVLERRQRHQKRRNRGKRLKASLST